MAGSLDTSAERSPPTLHSARAYGSVAAGGRRVVSTASVGALLLAVADGAILAGPVGATPPTLDRGEWALPKTEPVSGRESSRPALRQ